MKTAQWLLLIVFVLLFLVKGMQPAFGQIGTDFANYYTASWIVMHDRQETTRLYDQAWFAARATELGEPRGGIFQPFPPPTALLMIPLSGFSMKAAKDLWTVINLLMIAALVALLARLSKENMATTALILFGTGWAVVNTVYLGQVYLLMLLCLTLSVLLLSRGKDILAGVFAGVFIPIKYFPVCMAVLFLLEGRWRAVWSSLAAAAVVTVASVVILGWEVHAQFLNSVLSSHMDGQMSNPFALSYQSWNSLLRALFVKDQLLNPDPFIDWADGFPVARVVILVALVSALIASLRGQIHPARSTGSRVALLFAVTLLLSPASASYHMLLLALPAAMMLPALRLDSRKVALAVLAGSYFAIALLPVAGLDRISLHGIWVVLGYPRLFLLLFIFLTLVWLTSDRRWRTISEA